MMWLIPTSTKPAPSNSARSSSSVRKLVGPAGSPGGGGASAAATASSDQPQQPVPAAAHPRTRARASRPDAGPCNASASADLGPPHVVEHEVADDRVERALARRDRLERADAERDRRVGERRPPDHRGRDVDAHRVRTERRRGRRQLPRPRAHVQHLPAVRDAGEGEDRAADPPGHRREEAVRARALLPAGGLEPVEGLGVDGGGEDRPGGGERPGGARRRGRGRGDNAPPPPTG